MKYLKVSDEDMGWLDELSNTIRTEGIITEEDLAKLIELIKKYCLPCMFFPHSLGAGVEIFLHSEHPGIDPESILCIANLHMPKTLERTKESAGDDWLIETFSPLTHSEENKRILAFYDFPEQDSPDSYRY